MHYEHHYPRLSSSPASPLEPITVIGRTAFRNRRERFGLLPADRLRHLWIIGKTGSGKSTLLANLIAQDLARGVGLALLDPHGDLVETALSQIPRSRTNQVLLFDPTDRDLPGVLQRLPPRQEAEL